MEANRPKLSMIPPIISVIICTKDRPESLRETLASLEACLAPDNVSAEVIVVDNSDNGSAFSEFEQTDLLAIYFHERTPGKSIALNSGVKISRGSILVFTDDDVRFPPNWISCMAEPIINGGFSIVQGGVRPAPHLERPWLLGMLRTWVACVEDRFVPPIGCVGANMAITREAFDAAGGADIRLDPGASGFFGDTMLGLRAESLGFKKAYLPGVSVVHHFDESRLTVAGFMAIARRMAASKNIAMPEPRPVLHKRIYCTIRFLLARIRQSLSPDGWVCEAFVYWYYHTELNRNTSP